MEFTVPQFIEEKPKIVGPLTFKQSIYLGIATGIGTAFYFTLPTPFFILGTLVAFGVAGAFIFIKIEGHSIPELLKNFLFFSVSSKIYLWKRAKTARPQIIKVKKPEIKKEEVKKESPLKIGGQSRLKEISARLELGEK